MNFKNVKCLANAVKWAAALLIGLPISVAQAQQALDIATSPLSNSGSKKVKPNMLYVLDDSGSMGRDYMPDWANDSSGSHPGLTYHIDASYNSLAYNPAVRYDPPSYFTGSNAQKDFTVYPSQDGTANNRGSDGSSTRNWRRVKYDAYYSSSSHKNLETRGGANFNGMDLPNPQYAVSIANEYCSRTDLRECIKSNVPTVDYPYPARIRWCTDAVVAADIALPADNACQATRIPQASATNAGVTAFDHMRIPLGAAPTGLPYEATVTIENIPRRRGNRARVNQITVNGRRIMRYATNQTRSTSELAGLIAASINACTTVARGNCNISGYSAEVFDNVLTIRAPGSPSGSPNLSYSGNMTYSDTNFSQPSVAANREIVDIVPGNNSYHYPGRTTKYPTRTDCVGATCTYNEEMTNYANWFTYYHTRMQLMKTSTSIAFDNIDADLRMGFMTINTGSSKALDFGDFVGQNKSNWYNKLFEIRPSGYTPLRNALSKAGRIYANQYSLGGVFSDPMQHECQENFTLLTTDGKWNSSAGFRLDGSAMINMDGSSSEKGKYEGNCPGCAGSTHTLADVAKYYRDTDLRTAALSNCSGSPDADGDVNNVCATPDTTPSLNQHQSMVTFTLGLGVDGSLAYDVNYGPTVPGDYKRIYDGTLTWPKIPTSPNDSTIETIDDLWHAAVNADGRYFSAKESVSLVNQLREAIALIKVKTGAGAAAATSTLNPVSGDNFAYVASYTSGYWKGNLEKRLISTADGSIALSAEACVEDVVPEDNCKAPSVIEPDGNGGYECVTQGISDPSFCTVALVGSECREPVIPTCEGELKKQLETTGFVRKVYMNQSGSRVSFEYGNLTGAQADYFDKSFLVSNLTQGSTYNTDQLNTLTADKLVNYIKGDYTYELNSPLLENQLFRTRSAVLGDLIDSKPSFLGKSRFTYGDSGYQDFKTNTLTRAGTVYVGSNDGMLHAFDADTLEERWAFVPTVVIPNLWKLADSNYSANHEYYVNGDLTISDICVAADCSTATANDWKTILVAGLDGGGRGYYALDITDPTDPKVLWEIDPSTPGFENLGFTYGNPIVVKRSGDNKWVVAFTSGYNNIRDDSAFYNTTTDFKPTVQFTTGDGQGYLYVVNANTGALLDTIGTGSGSTTSPSGLAKINAYVENAQINQVATYIYGGDLDGNVWRFNIDANQGSALHFATLRDQNNVAQPVMTKPELAEAAGNRLVFVGTGKYLEVSDLGTTTPQSLYGIKDVASGAEPQPVYSNPRATSGFIEQTIVPSTDPTRSDERFSGSNREVNFTSDLGWYIDLPDSGERQNVASQLILGTLLVPTTVPSSTACQPGGFGWFNYLDYRTGLSVIAPFGSLSQRTSAPSVGFNVVYVDGKPVVSNVQADDPNPTVMQNVKFKSDGGQFDTRRSIWREITQ